MGCARWRLVWVTALAALAVLAWSGCGGDGGAGDAGVAADDAGTESPISPPPGDFAVELAGTLSTAKDRRACRPIVKLNESSAYDFGCPMPDDVARSLRAFEVVGAAAYGTGAVVDYRTRLSKDGASMTLSVTPKGEWAVNRFGLINEPSVGTSDAEARKGYDEVVATFLEAVRERDCDAYLGAAISSSLEPKTVCRKEFPFTKPLATRLKASPGAEPRYLGGNERFGFYALELERPEPSYWTIGTVTTPEGSLRPQAVLSVIRGPTADGQP